MPKSIYDQVTLGETLHEWAIAEYEEHSRSPFWYIIMISIGLLLVAYGIFAGNFLFSFIIVLAAIILFLQSQQKPIEVPFRITDVGIIVANRLYAYSELENFFIIYHPPEVKMLYIDTRNVFKPLIRIPLYNQNPVEVRHTLQEFLVEDLEKEDEPLSDRLARNWGLH